MGLQRMNQLGKLPLPSALKSYVHQTHNLAVQLQDGCRVARTSECDFIRALCPSRAASVVYALIQVDNSKVPYLLQAWPKIKPHPSLHRCYYTDTRSNATRHMYALENFEAKSIDDWIATNQSYTRAIRVFLDITEAICYLHQKRIYSTRIVPSKIIFTGEGRVKLTFLPINDCKYDLFQPPRYPHYSRCSEKDDVWRLAVLFHRIMYKISGGGGGGGGESSRPSAQQISRLHADVARRQTSYADGRPLSSRFARFLIQCLSVNPTRRPTVEQVRDFAKELCESRGEGRRRRPASAPVVLQRRKELAARLTLVQPSLSVVDCIDETNASRPLEWLERLSSRTTAPVEKEARKAKKSEIVWPASTTYFVVSSAPIERLEARRSTKLPSTIKRPGPRRTSCPNSQY